VCSVCPCSFSNEHDREVHMSQQHDHFGEKAASDAAGSSDVSASVTNSSNCHGVRDDKELVRITQDP
jgi:hypothetical protein